MVNLTNASQELFRREPDERFRTLDELSSHCTLQRENSFEHWKRAEFIRTLPDLNRRSLELRFSDEDQTFSLNDWTFSQLCRLCTVSKDTVNKVSPGTAADIFRDTMPALRKPLQLYTVDGVVRSIHGTAYTRLYNTEVLEVVRDAATEFTPPPVGFNGSTGLYCGEQDMFIFLIDESGPVEVQGENFFPGLFAWNSEVGRRTVGVQTFWYQEVCANHIVWDAIEVTELARKHTKNVGESLDQIRQLISDLGRRRDERRDRFAKGIASAMHTKIGSTPDEVQKELVKKGLPHRLVTQAISLVPATQGYTLFSLVDALTRLSGRRENAGDRLALDVQAAALLSVAA